MTTLVDVVEVRLSVPHTVRVIATDKSEQDASAIQKMAVIRRGVDSHFFTTCEAGKFRDGDDFTAGARKR